jgi:hypothetical protein
MEEQRSELDALHQQRLARLRDREEQLLVRQLLWPPVLWVPPSSTPTALLPAAGYLLVCRGEGGGGGRGMGTCDASQFIVH